jgi:hypothetical protein
MRKISHYLGAFKPYLQNLNLIEGLIYFIVVLNTLCILIEYTYFSFINIGVKDGVIIWSLSVFSIILIVISGFVTVSR